MTKNRKQPEFVTGLDIGSTAVRVAIGQVVGDDATGNDAIQIVATVEVPSDGLNRGNITSIENVVSSIANALESAERLIGYPLQNVWIGVSNSDVSSQISKGVVAVAKSDGEISPEDVERAIESAKAVNAPLNYDVLHVLPKTFTVDGQTGIKDPVGMTGMRLEVETQMIHGPTAHLRNLTKAVYRTGVDIEDLVLSVLAVGDTVTTARQKDLGVAVVNIGGPSTSIIIYEDGDVLHTASLPIGSDHITNDLAIGLRTSIDIAENVKRQFDRNILDKIPKREVLNLQDVGAPQAEHIPKQYIAEIIEARVSEILEKVNEEFKRAEREGLLPAGAVFTGGGAMIPGIVDLAKEALCLPAQVGTPVGVGGVSENLHNPAFTSAIGLVKWGATLSKSPRKRRKFGMQSMKVADGVKKFFRSIMP
ncbi:cell division protein FtsA [Candidatus Nomurabacteria bacterium]|nr:cell division protein FtsA [Candidatus Nomurabacteria bacterium]